MKANEKVKDIIYFTYATLGDGETQSGEVCPVCKGGFSNEKSLSVTKRGGTLLFNCHRNSCDLRGAVTVGGMPSLGPGESTLDRAALYPRIPTEQLNQAGVKFLATRYGIPPESIEYAGFGWSGDAHGRYGRRISMPIYGPDSKERGTQYRSFEGVAPKAITELRSDDAIAASWYKWLRTSDTLIIVEDQASAIKLAPFVHSLALLGTNMPEELAKEVAEQKYKRVLISLDNDATWNAIKMQLQWRSTIKGLLVSALDKDIKDMTENEFDEYLHSTELQRPKLLEDEPVLGPDLPGWDDDFPF